MADITRTIVVPVDGSPTALRSLEYLNLIYGPDQANHNLEVMLLYVIPTLPTALTDDPKLTREDKLRLKAVEDKNVEVADRLLGEAKKNIIQRGFQEKRIKTVHIKKKTDIARDMCFWTEKQGADALFITSRGRSRVQAFFMGEISRKLLEHCKVCPVWIVGASFRSKNVFAAIDSSENALRAVDHLGFLLSGTDCKVTLFHSLRNLRRFLPLEVLETAPDLQKIWEHKAGEQIAPYIRKAQEMLHAAGIDKCQISTKIVDGSRSPAKDIIDHAKRAGCETVVLGRRGQSAAQAFSMGSVAGKVLEGAEGMTVCVVP